MELKESIHNLIELQKIDLQVRKLDDEIEQGNIELAKRQAKIETEWKAVADLELRAEACAKRRRELEAEIEDEYANVKDRQAKMMNVQTNREYQSLLKEIEDGKESNRQREDEVMLLTEEIESIQKKLAEAKNLCAGEASLLKEETSRVEGLATKMSSEKGKIIKNRAEKAQLVAANILNRYELLRQKRNGLAIVGVVNGVCLGCNMNIPPQMFNNLLRQQEMLSCPICNRMMYYQSQPEPNTP